MSLEYNTTLCWKALAVLPREPEIHKRNLLFAVSPGTGLSKQFGIHSRFCYAPHILTPTSVYHQFIRNELKRIGIAIHARRFPYRLNCKPIGDATLNVHLRLFPPNILSITVILSDLQKVPDPLDPIHLISWQKLDNIKSIYEILRLTLRAVQSFDHKKLGDEVPFRFKPGVYLENPGTDHLDKPILTIEEIEKFVAIVIRHQGYKSMSHEIAASVLRKNHDQNLKDPRNLLLIDKQGLLYVVPASDERRAERGRFARVSDLYELAMVYGAFLSEYHELRAHHEDLADFLFCRIKSWILQANVVFSDSVSNRNIWLLLCDELGLKTLVHSIVANTELSAAISSKESYFNPFIEWWKLSDFESVLSEKIAVSNGLGFGFLHDIELRKLVTADYREAERSFEGRNYKSVILLCGSIVEAMLTEALANQNVRGLTRERMYKFALAELIQEAEKNNLIGDPTVRKFLDPIREYRNMIHPGVVLRRELHPDASKARIALEVVKLIAKEFETPRLMRL